MHTQIYKKKNREKDPVIIYFLGERKDESETSPWFKHLISQNYSVHISAVDPAGYLVCRCTDLHNCLKGASII